MSVIQQQTTLSVTNGQKGHFGKKSTLNNEQGATAVLVAVLIFFLTAMASFAVDLGFAWVTQNELQNIADASALAGTSELGAIYSNLTPSEQKDTNRTLSSMEKARILAKITEVAGLNKAGGKSGITIDLAADVNIGTWSFATKTVTTTLTRPTAVTVTARRDNNANGPIRTFFANVMGFSEMSVAATATAALGPVGTINPGESNIPVGISKRWFEEGRECGDSIKFHPTGDLDGCAGWHTYTEGPANAAKLEKILTGLADETYTSPEMKAGESYVEFSGGTIASAFDAMKNLYETHRDPNTLEWDVKIPVYDSDDCSNPSGAIKIVGFVSATVYQVVEAPDKQIIARVTCDEIQDGRPGGGLVDGSFSPLSTIPALVS